MWLWVRASARTVRKLPVPEAITANPGTHARTLAAGCEHLLAEKDRLCEFAAALRAKLAVFEQLDRLAVQLHKASVSPQAAVEHLPALLQECDACVAFCSSHPQYAEAQAYGIRFRQLQSRALTALRGAASALLRRAVAQATQAAAEVQPPPVMPAEGQHGGQEKTATATPIGTPSPQVEAALHSALYVRFRAASSELRSLLAYPQARAAAGLNEYVAVLEDVRALYAESRAGLMAPYVSQRVLALVATHGEDACALATWGADSLMALAGDEHDLWASVFDDARPGDLLPLMEQLAVPLYDALRLATLQLGDLDTLRDLVEALQRTLVPAAHAGGAENNTGMPGRRFQQHPDAAAAVLPPLARALADARERLAFRAQTFLRQHVATYAPSAEDMALVIRSASQQQQQVYGPVAAALACLSRLYGAVETDTFGGLAQEAVTAAVAAVNHAAAAASAGADGKGKQLDSLLFVVSQLLSLRDQVAPFDAEFVITQRALDLSSMRGVVRRILAGGGALEGSGPAGPGGVSATSALSQSHGAMAGAPVRTVEAQVDGRVELEKALKGACESFILAVTKAAIEPLLGFLAKAAAARGSGSSAGQPPLKAQAFAAPARVAELVQQCQGTTQEALRDAAARTRVYLPAPQVAAVLLRPVKANIAEAHAQLAALLDAEFAPQEVAAVRLASPEELRRTLDTACEGGP